MPVFLESAISQQGTMNKKKKNTTHAETEQMKIKEKKVRYTGKWVIYDDVVQNSFHFG